MSPLLAAGFIERYLFEQPWPAIGLLAAAALILAWRGLGSGDRRPLPAAAALALCAGIVALLAFLVTTPAERATAIVREFVARAERGETSGMLELLSPTASFHYGRPENPGLGMDEVRTMLRTLEGRYRIEANTITQLDATSESRTVATVLLTNRTSVAIGHANVPNSWWLRIAEQPSGEWLIERIAFLRVAGQTPGSAIWR